MTLQQNVTIYFFVPYVVTKILRYYTTFYDEFCISGLHCSSLMTSLPVKFFCCKTFPYILQTQLCNWIFDILYSLGELREQTEIRHFHFIYKRKRNTTALNKAVKPAMFGAVIGSVMVITVAFKSGEHGSNLGRTSSFARKKVVTFLTVCGYLPPQFFNFFDFLISYHSTCQYRSNIIFAVSLCFCFAVIEGN